MKAIEFISQEINSSNIMNEFSKRHAEIGDISQIDVMHFPNAKNVEFDFCILSISKVYQLLFGEKLEQMILVKNPANPGYCFKNITDVQFQSSKVKFCDYCFAEFQKLSSFKFPYQQDAIPNGMFCNDTCLSSLDIPEEIQYVGDNAFQNCSSLKSLSFGKDIKHIGKEAFLNCSSLEELTIDNADVHISLDAFNGCTSLKKVNVYDGTWTEKRVKDALCNAFIK